MDVDGCVAASRTCSPYEPITTKLKAKLTEMGDRSSIGADASSFLLADDPSSSSLVITYIRLPHAASIPSIMHVYTLQAVHEHIDRSCIVYTLSYDDAHAYSRVVETI